MQQSILQIDFGGVVLRFGTHIAAIGLHQPGALVVGQRQGEGFADDAGFEWRILNRNAGFHAAEQVASHPVGAGNPHFAVAMVFKIKHARVLQQAADNRAHADVVRQARHAGA